MTTGIPTRRTRAHARRSRAFSVGFAIVIAVLAAVALGGAALTTLQGPRITDVQFDPQAAITSSGSRVILTTTQSLADIDPDQVHITPEAAFTVDTSGRSLGVRFALPLWDDTEYTITVTGVTGVGGGPASTLTQTFTTPALEAYLLQRGDGEAEDTIFRTDLDGDAAVPVYTNAHIEDFRATASHLVIVTTGGDGSSRLVVTDLDGQDERELTLPGTGMVTNLQSADRGNLIGYTFTDASIGADGGREEALFTTSLGAGAEDDEPTAIEREGGDSRVDDWRFVPGTDSILMLTFDGALTLVSGGTTAAAPVALGNALTIDGIARGSATAIVERADGLVALDLSTGEDAALPPADAPFDQSWEVLALPDGSGATLRIASDLAADGLTVLGTSAAVVDADGTTRTVFDVDPADALLHMCVSPSGRYAAFLLAPDIVSNPYDTYLLPLPTRLQTHIVSLDDGAEVVALHGFGISWCQSAPRG